MTGTTLEEANKPAAPVRLPSLTGLRWLAASMVFGFHLSILNPTSNPHLSFMPSVFGMGGIGVNFFFVLSGFILMWSIRPGDTKRAFWRRRFARIYPAHVVAWAIAVAGLVGWGVQVSLKADLANLLLVNPWVFKPGWAGAGNGVAWSLACEAFFYLLLPFALPFIKRLSVAQLYVMLLLVPLAIILMNLAVRHYVPPAEQGLMGFFPPMRLPEFWAGVVVGELVLRRSWGGPGLWAGSALVVVCYIASTNGGELTALQPIVFATLIAGAAQADIRGVWSPWRWPALVWLGEASYAFYLVHALVITNAIQLFGVLDLDRRYWFGVQPLLGAGGLFPIGTLALALLAAAVLHHGVERPMMRVLSPRRRPRPAAAPVPAMAQAQRHDEPAPSALWPDATDQTPEVEVVGVGTPHTPSLGAATP